MRVAGYIRVSTSEQAMHGYSLEAQRELIEKYCKDNGHKLIGVYADEGKSASKQLHRRTEIVRLLDDAENGLFDLIVFKDLTRWSRNPSQFYAVQDRLDKAKVSWIAIEQPNLETVTASGKLIVGIHISVAAHESAQTSDRVKFVNASRMQNGGAICGDPYLPLGYTVKEIDGMKRVVIDETLRQMVYDIFDIFEREQTIQSIIHMTLEKYQYRTNASSLRNMLKNPLYKGEYHGIENYTEAYLTSERWDAIQRIRSQRHYTAPVHKNEYVFSSVVRCAVCGGTMCGRTTPSGTVYYLCRKNLADKTCPHNRTIREDQIEDVLLKTIDAEASRFVASATQKAKEKKSVAPMKAKLARLREIYIDGDISKDEYTRRKEQLEKEIADASNDPARAAERLKTAFPNGWQELYQRAPKKARNVAWRSVVKRIEVDEQNNITPIFI